ncbi:MAG: Flp pilus assembly protein CpaB [Pseudomonadota bacterium]
MKIIAILVLIFGVSLAGGAIYFASIYFEEFEARMRNSAPEGPKTVNVIVAKTQLRYGTVLKPNEHLRWVAWPEDALPEGAFTEAKALLGDDGVEDKTRVVLRQIEPGEPILESKISGFGARGRMAMQLSEGMRAFTIRIDAVSGVAGFIAPGDRVDVLMTRNVNGGLESTVVLQNILVIAVDHETNQQSNAPRIGRTATVEVSSEVAQKLALAQQVGRLSLTLRGLESHDVEDADPQTVNVRDLLGIEEAPAAAPAPQVPRTAVTVRRGGAITDRLEFQED